MKYLAEVDYSNLLDKSNPELGKQTVGGLVNEIIPYVFFGAGIALMLVIISGGIGLMTSGGDPKKVQSAQGKITSALIGFVIVFAAYWIVQLVYKILGVEPTIKII